MLRTKLSEERDPLITELAGAIAKLVDVINRDNRAVLTVSTFMEDVEGVKNVNSLLPHIIGGEGDLGVLPISLNVKEKMLLKKSAEIIRAKIDEYEKKSMIKYFAGIDVQISRGCSYYILDNNKNFIASGWVKENIPQSFENLFLEISYNQPDTIAIGIDAPRMPIRKLRTRYFDKKKIYG
ncbi:MAG: hypothetical protein MZV64_03645 [Ignavibacteriales bacterium]|nr:hypothetical protein [Ignavibacteriales bacterium]